MNNIRHKQNNDAIKPTKNNFRQKHKLGTSKQIGNIEKMVTKIQKKNRCETKWHKKSILRNPLKLNANSHSSKDILNIQLSFDMVKVCL